MGKPQSPVGPGHRRWRFLEGGLLLLLLLLAAALAALGVLYNRGEWPPLPRAAAPAGARSRPAAGRDTDLQGSSLAAAARSAPPTAAAQPPPPRRCHPGGLTWPPPNGEPRCRPPRRPCRGRHDLASAPCQTAGGGRARRPRTPAPSADRQGRGKAPVPLADRPPLSWCVQPGQLCRWSRNCV